MRQVFSSTVFCKTGIVYFPKPIRFKHFSGSFGTEPSAPITTGTTIAADDHIHWTLLHKSVYSSFFSIIFCLKQQSPGIVTSINLTVLDAPFQLTLYLGNCVRLGYQQQS